MFGQLYLQKGLWNGEKILDEAWIKEATSTQISNGNDPNSDWAQGYGYQFWRCRHNVYRGDGAFGQYCIVMPHQDSVIAITSGVDDMQKVLNLVWEHLLPEMSEIELTEDVSAQNLLNQKMVSLALKPPAAKISSPTANKVCCNAYKLQGGELDSQNISFIFDEEKCSLKVWGTRGDHAVSCGLEKWVEQYSDILGSNSHMCVTGTWIAEDTFEILLRLVETPFTYKVSCKFEEAEFTMTTSVNVGFGSKEPQILKGTLVSEK